MSVAANTITTATAVGSRESLSDKIYRVAPEETPVLSALGPLGAAKAYYEEWLTESLNAATKDNAAIDGASVANSAQTPAARVGNRIQLFVKVASVADGQEMVEVAGNSNKMKRELAAKSVELRRDMETSALSNNASVAMTTETAGKLGGLQAWLTSNVSRGANGANGGFANGTVAASTGGTDRTIAYSDLIGVMQSRFTNSGSAREGLLAVMPASVKTTYWNTFTGLSINRVQNNATRQGAKVTGAIDIIETDFGQLSAVPHPYAFATGEKPILIIDPAMAEMRALGGGIIRKPLAKVGTAERELLECYATLCVKNEKAHAIVTDITAS